jgi:glycosyltransferase involved in cell wall biosynthesis
MHILIIHQAFASFNEPGGTRHYEFAHLLAARGHKVTVIASPVSYITGQKIDGAGQMMIIENGVSILRAKTYTAHHKSFYHRIIAFLSFMFSSFWIGLGVKNVDLVWGTSPPIFQGATALILARLKRAKFLFEVRDLWPEFAIAVGVLKNPLIIRMSEWLEQFLYQHADKIIVNSPGFINHVRARQGKDIELIPNGADPDMFKPVGEGAEFRHAVGLHEEFIVLYAGAHGMSNDLDIVLDAAKILQNISIPDEKYRPELHQIKIVLLGDGKEKLALQMRASEMGLSNIIFLPSIPKKKMVIALSGMDAGIAILKPLDEYKTTYPNKVFDYMAAGKPVVLAIDGVIRQVVEAAECGIFVEPGNAEALAKAINMLRSNPEKARAMGMKGRKYLEENFSRGKMVDKLEIILKNLIGHQKN